MKEILDLGFGRCKLQVQAPENGDVKEPKDLIGKNIVTSFTNLTEAYFRKLEAEQDGEAVNGEGERKLRTNIKYVGGSVEAACALGVADGIVDLVESGETMRAAGLKAISTVMDTSAWLISSKNPTNPELVERIRARIQGVISMFAYTILIYRGMLIYCTAAQKYVLCTYNIERKELASATKIAPGRRAPTVNALDDDGWVAVSVMIPNDKKGQIMDDLWDIGARDILITKIENTRTV